MNTDEIVQHIDTCIAEIDKKTAHLLAEREKLRRAREVLRPGVPDVPFPLPFLPVPPPPGISFPCLIGVSAGQWMSPMEPVITINDGFTLRPSPAEQPSAP